MQDLREMQVILIPTTFSFTSLFLFLGPLGTTVHLTQQDLQMAWVAVPYSCWCSPASLALRVRNELGAMFCQLMLCQFQGNARSQLCTSGKCNKLQAVCFFSPMWKQIAFRDREQAAHGWVTICTTRCICCWDQYLFLVKVPMTFVQLELSPPHTPHLSYWSLDPMMPSQPVRMHFPRTHTELL